MSKNGVQERQNGARFLGFPTFSYRQLHLIGDFWRQ